MDSNGNTIESQTKMGDVSLFKFCEARQDLKPHYHSISVELGEYIERELVVFCRLQ